MGKLGPTAAAVVPALIKALRAKDYPVRHAAAIALGDIGPAAVAAIPMLIESTRDESPWVRKGAVHALGVLGPATTDVVPALIGALRDESPKVRRLAVLALGRIGPVSKEVIYALIKLLVSGCCLRIVDIPGIDFVIQDISQIDDEEEPPVIRDTPAIDFHHVAEALIQCDQDAAPDLVDIIRNENNPMRLPAAKVLARLGDHGLAELKRLQADPNPDISRCAREALVGCGLPPEVIVTSLGSDTPWDAEAGKMLKDLKVFFLVGCAYRAGHCSLRAADRHLADVMLANSKTDDLAVTNVSFKKNIAKLTPLSRKVLGNDGVTLLIMSKKESQHLPARFSEDGWRMWAWSEAFLRRHLGDGWWGLSLAGRDA